MFIVPLNEHEDPKLILYQCVHEQSMGVSIYLHFTLLFFLNHFLACLRLITRLKVMFSGPIPSGTPVGRGHGGVAGVRNATIDELEFEVAHLYNTSDAGLSYLYIGL